MGAGGIHSSKQLHYHDLAFAYYCYYYYYYIKLINLASYLIYFPLCPTLVLAVIHTKKIKNKITIHLLETKFFQYEFSLLIKSEYKRLFNEDKY